MRKLTGAEIKVVWNWFWQGDNLKNYYFESDESLYDVENDDGEFILSLDQEYDAEDIGPAVWQGDEDDYRKNEYLEFVDIYEMWGKAMKSDCVVHIVIPKVEVPELDTFLKVKGWKRVE